MDNTYLLLITFNSLLVTQSKKKQTFFDPFENAEIDSSKSGEVGGALV